MQPMHVFIYSLILLISETVADESFPSDFLFGIASSAYQIEGGHDSDGKGVNIWDHHLHSEPSLVSDQSNGDIACDSYNKYNDDLELLHNLGVHFYRFSISWTRILPNGRTNHINQAGIDYYNNLIDGLKQRNIEAMVTLYHWDLPKALQDLGGWTNPLLAQLFEDYARLCFERFGDRVKFWITFNSNWMGYGDAQWPPRLNQSGIGEYLYIKHILVAHARVYHLYVREFKQKQNGEVGITIDGRWLKSMSDDIEDLEATERALEFSVGIFANPIFGSGDFPKIVKDRVDYLSAKEKFAQSRLPSFTKSEIDLIKGAFDFLGINVYTAFLIKNGAIPDDAPFSLVKDMNVRVYQSPDWPKSHADWLTVTPFAMRGILNWLKSKYGNVKIIVTENGYADDGELNDSGRINYYKLYLNQLLHAIYQDGVNVKGYAAWSLLDNFEWLSGYSEKFGLHHVDFADDNRKRTPKASARWYRDLIAQRRIPRDDVTLNDEL